MVTPVNVVLGGVAVTGLLASLLAYKFSNSYKVRVWSLYVALGLIPLSAVFMQETTSCNSWMNCMPRILGLVSKGLLASAALIGIVYYRWGSQLCVKAMKAKQLDRELFPQVYETLEDVCSTLNVKTPRVYYMDSGKPKAMSISGSQDSIVLSVGVFELLEENELKAVLAHEVAHLKERHSLIKTISRFIGLSYVYGFGLSKNLEREQEKHANDVAGDVVDKKALAGAIEKFNT